MQKAVTAAFRAGDKQVFELASQHFILLLQDQLQVPGRKDKGWNFRIEAANIPGQTREEKALYEWNAPCSNCYAEIVWQQIKGGLVVMLCR